MKRPLNTTIIGLLVLLVTAGLVAHYWFDTSRPAPDSDDRSPSENAPASPVADLAIRLDQPQPEQLVTSPLMVTGEARGYWYFEADFPVRLLDAEGHELAVAPAQAQGDWMVEEFVPFAVELEFAEPVTTRGELVLERDNPSGLPENDDQLVVPVRFR
jgi:hypothetical protein